MRQVLHRWCRIAAALAAGGLSPGCGPTPSSLGASRSFDYSLQGSLPPDVDVLFVLSNAEGALPTR